MNFIEDGSVPASAPFQAIALTADVLRHEVATERGRETIEFAVDLDSIVAKNPCVVDFNHDADEIVGLARVSSNGGDRLIADGALTPFFPTDRASEIRSKAARGVPYGISPTFDFSAATRVDVEPGETFRANGRNYFGPLVIFQNAPLLGLSVCPYPTDDGTDFTLLKRVVFTRLNRDANDASNPTKKENAMEDEKKKDATDAAKPTELEVEGNGTDAETIKNAELKEYVDKFGLKLGVDYYQKGVPLADATDEAFSALKSENVELRAQISKLSDGASCVDAKDDGKKDKRETDANDAASPKESSETELSKLRRAVETQTRALSTLRREFATYLSADATGVSASPDVDAVHPKPKSYRDAFAASIARK